MFLARRPSLDTINRFLHHSQDLPLSYGPIGIVSPSTVRNGIDELAVTIGHGQPDFARARAALIAWKQFDIGWVETFPPNAPVAVGTVVAVLIHHVGFWSLNGCRVVYLAGDAADDARFGFAYGALTNHAQAGEELFEVLIDPRTEDVRYRIRARSWPQTALARVGQPIVRALQARFRLHSAATMERAARLAALRHPM